MIAGHYARADGVTVQLPKGPTSVSQDKDDTRIRGCDT